MHLSKHLALFEAKYGVEEVESHFIQKDTFEA